MARREHVEQDGSTGIYRTRIAAGHPSPLRRALRPAAAPTEGCRLSCSSSIHRQRRSVPGQDAPTDRKKLLSAAGTEAARRTAGRPPTLGDDTAAACPCPLLLLLASAAAVATLYGFCGVFGAALRGNCAFLCVARTQHWMPNRKTSISMAPFLHMHVLYGLRLTFYLRLVVLPMQIALLVLVADLGHHIVVLIACVFVTFSETHILTQRCEWNVHTRHTHTHISKQIACVTCT
ncbi:hypothetical protein TCSYLVIO_009612 [Trypanosoma cruzi]|nr:hypothetical protein TCSYLVIO_009612 [Trypanosoma cruzi]